MYRAWNFFVFIRILLYFLILCSERSISRPLQSDNNECSCQLWWLLNMLAEKSPSFVGVDRPARTLGFTRSSLEQCHFNSVGKVHQNTFAVHTVNFYSRGISIINSHCILAEIQAHKLKAWRCFYMLMVNEDCSHWIVRHVTFRYNCSLSYTPVVYFAL